MERLPLKRFVIKDEEDGMDFMGVVDIPAHGKPFMLFNKQVKSNLVFNEEKREVYGVAIATQLPIYRNENGFEYYGVFYKDEVLKIAQRFFKRLNVIHNVNFDHDHNKILKGVNLFFSYIIDKDKGLDCPELFKNQKLEDGSWIVGYKVESSEVWKEIKSGKFKGFSIEIFAGIENVKFKNKQMSKEKKSLFERLFGKAKVFETATTIDGVTIKWEGEPTPNETQVYIVDGDGNEVLAPEGEYVIQEGENSIALVINAEGTLIEVKDVTEMKDDEEEEEEEDDFEAVVTELKKENDTLKTELSALKQDFESLKVEFSKGKKTVVVASTTQVGRKSLKDLIK
jgi:hypothetical protein